MFTTLHLQPTAKQSFDIEHTDKPRLKELLFIKHLSFSYAHRSQQTLSDVTLTVRPGEAVCLAGPNGAGKSTLLKLCSGQLTPSEGSITIEGRSCTDWHSHTSFGFVPQYLAFPTLLTVRECIRTVAAYKNASIIDWIVLTETFKLEDVLDRKLSQLSGGYQRRVAIMLAFIGNPKLLLLDEPLVGVDIESKSIILSALSNFQRHSGAILWTTHDLRDLDALDASIIIMSRGQLMFSGQPNELTNGFLDTLVEAKIPEDAPDIAHTQHVSIGNSTLYFLEADAKPLLVENQIKNQFPQIAMNIRVMSIDEAYWLYLSQMNNKHDE